MRGEYEDTALIGFDPLHPDQRADPYPTYARARSEQPVFYAPELDLWVITRYDDVKAVLTDPETFSSKSALKSAKFDPSPEALAVLSEEGYPEMPLIIDSDGALHRRIRGLVSRAFTPRRVRDMEPRLFDLAGHLIDGFVDHGATDLIESFAWPFPLRAMGDMLGVPADDLPDLHRLSQDWLLFYQDVESEEKQVELAKSIAALQRYFAAALEERESSPRDDLMTALLEAQREAEEPLGMGELIGVPLDLLVAGHVTVTRAIGSAVVLLLRHPEELRRLREDPGRIPSTVEEILRMESPAQGLFRTATREAVVGGVSIPEGARLMVHFGSANRDEEYFDDPDRFDPERTDLNKHVAFGHGPHFCLGSPLARLELEIALRLLIERLPGLRLQDVDPPFEYDPVFFARGFTHLHVAWDPP